MHPLINVYAKVMVDSLNALPDELQHLVSSIRSSDVRITNVLSEMQEGGLDEKNYTRLALQLKRAYKSKKDTAVRFVGVLKTQLEQLDNSQRAVLGQVKDISDPVRNDILAMQEVTTIDSPFYGTPKSILEFVRKTRLKMREEEATRSKLKRKPTPNESVNSVEIQHVEPTTITLNMSQTAGDKSACVCEGATFGDMVLCDNDQCRVGWYHYTCVGLSSKPLGEWYCSECK